jgi:hypothetical protein
VVLEHGEGELDIGGTDAKKMVGLKQEIKTDVVRVP